MKYYSPLLPEVIDVFCQENSISGMKLYTLEKITQLDAEILMSYNKTQLGELYNLHRQTITNHINELINQNIILETSIGNILILPTHTGCFGVYYGQYEGLHRFILTLPNTQIHVYMDIYEDEIAPELRQSLISGICYYLKANVPIQNTQQLSDNKDYFHISIIANTCVDLYQINDLGYSYQDKQFIKKGLI